MPAHVEAPHPAIARLRDRIEPLRRSLLDHPVYAAITDAPALRAFMEAHAFAVWDFMSLLKALQQRVCCVSVPWTPPADPAACHLINAIVLAEESDEDGRGGHASHYDLYVAAMRACGADAATLERFVDRTRAGRALEQAFDDAGVAEPARRFVGRTFRLIDAGEPAAIASAFAFGREDLLPDVFGRIVAELDRTSHGAFGEFRYYLDRHIELDGDDHGPMAERLVASLCAGDPARWDLAERAAVEALGARVELWDGIHRAIEAGKVTPGASAPPSR